MMCQVRRVIVPFAFALVLTVAAGLSLAEEHAWTPAEGPDTAVTPSDMLQNVAKPDGRGADRNPSADRSAMGGPEQNEHTQAEDNVGVGSRALSGHD